MEKVSVVIPVYNVEKYLRECVDSVLGQTYSELEVILVDDGSPDNCGAICDEYAEQDGRITVIHKKNGGLSDARNAGLKQVSGKYVYFLDSDDYLKKDAIEILVDTAEKENADVIFFSAETVYEDYEYKSIKDDFARKQSYPAGSGSSVVISMLENKEYIPCVQLQFYREALLSDNGISFRKGMLHEDELFTILTALKSGRTAVINDLLYVRRQRAGSIMSGVYTARSFEGAEYCIRHFIHLLQGYPKGSEEWKMLILDIALLMNHLTNKFVMLPKEDRKELQKRFSVLKKWCASNGYLGDRKLRIKLNSVKLFRAFKQTKEKAQHIRKKGQ